MYLNLFDIAVPVAANVNDFQATKNPETYVWFALANYMSLEGTYHQDWSTGACRAAGSLPNTVIVTVANNWPKRTAIPTNSVHTVGSDTRSSFVA